MFHNISVLTLQNRKDNLYDAFHLFTQRDPFIGDNACLEERQQYINYFFGTLFTDKIKNISLND